MISELLLESASHGALVLVTVTCNGDDLTAEATIALRDAPEGTVYTLRNPDGTISYIRTEQPLSEGLHFWHGDPEHFGRQADIFLFCDITKILGGHRAG